MADPIVKEIFEEKKKKFLREINHYTISIQASSRAIQRFIDIKDPVARYTFITTIFASLSDVALTALHVSLIESLEGLEDLDNSDDPQYEKEISKVSIKAKSLESQMEDLVKNMDTYFGGLSDWIQTPTYEPNHPLGREMLKNAESDFSERNKRQKIMQNYEDSKKRILEEGAIPLTGNCFENRKQA